MAELDRRRGERSNPFFFLARFLVERPLSSLAIAGAVLLLTLPGLLGVKADFSHEGFFFAGDPELSRYQDFQEHFGNDDTVVVAVTHEGAQLDRRSHEIVSELTRSLESTKGILGVESITKLAEAMGTPMEAQAEATREPGFLVSPDGSSTLVVAHVARGADAAAISSDVDLIVSELETSASDHRLRVTGTPAITAAFEVAAQNDLERIIPLTIAVMSLVMLLLLRSLVSVAVAFLSVTLAIVSTMGLAGTFGIAMNNLTMAVPQILLAVGMAASVHLLASFHRQLDRGAARKDAVEYALRKNLFAMGLTTVTTAVGFLSLMTADLKPIFGLGVLAGVGTVLVWCFTALVGAPLLVMLPRKRRSSGTGGGSAALARRYLDGLVRRRGLVLTASIAIVAVAAFGVGTIEIDSDPLEYFSERVEVRRDSDFIESSFGGFRGFELVFDRGETGSRLDGGGPLAELHRWLEESPNVALVRGLEALEMGATTSSPDGPRWLSEDGRWLRLSVLWNVASSSEVMRRVQGVEERMQELGLSGFVTGKTFLYQSMNGHVVRSFLRSLFLALVSISLILTISLRSVRLGLLALIPNSLPLLFGVGLFAFLGKKLDMGSVIVASVCLGIAVDDTIHILATFNARRRAGASEAEAVLEVLDHRTPALIMTTLILVLAFGTFLLGSFVPNATFGLFCAAILSIALVADLTLLPLLLLGRRGRAQRRALRNDETVASRHGATRLQPGAGAAPRSAAGARA